MNPLGIFSTVYGSLPTAELAERIRRDGFSCTHLEPHTKALADPDGEFDVPRVRAIRQAFADAGVQIAAVGGYTNLVDADEARRDAGIAKLERLIDVAPEFGTPYLATETGSLNPESPWSDYAANHTQAAWNELMRILQRLAKRARAAGTILLIEGYVNNVVATTAQAEKLLHELGSDVIGFVLDPFNYMTRADLQTPAESMARIVRTLAPHAKIAHAKDVRYGANGVETPKVGDGRADWRAYAKALTEQAPELPLVLEHLRPDEIEGCVAKVQSAFS